MILKRQSKKELSALRPPPSAGFTLVELMVAIALFSVLIAVAVGGFANALRTEREVSSFMTADSNVSLAIEQVTREVRTGSDFCQTGGSSVNACGVQIGTDSVTGAPVYNELAFTNADGQAVVYDVQNGILEKSSDGGATYQAITAANATIPYFTVTAYGTATGDDWNSRITIDLGVSPSDPALSSQVVHLQTTVSSRVID